MKASPLLSFNPEFQRNLWLELTPTRLVAMPVVLMLLIGGIWSISGPIFAGGVVRFLLWALLIFWGSRLAAGSFSDEIVGRTWDTQRLSNQKAFGLTLGKLFGGTAYAWYGAAICAAALILFQDPNAASTLADAALSGLVAQSTAFFTVLVLQRFNLHLRRTHTTLAQIIGVIAAWKNGLLSLPAQIPNPLMSGAVTWYGHDFTAHEFLVAVQITSIMWLIFGSMRIVRQELGFVGGPAGWSLYTLYAVVLAAGYVPSDGVSPVANIRLLNLSMPMAVLGMESLVGLATMSLTYVALVGVPISGVSLRKLSGAVAARDWIGVWRNLPMWTPSAMAAVIAALLLSARLATEKLSIPGPLMPIGALGFLARDITLIYLLRLNYRHGTALALLITFILLYFVVPPLLFRIDHGLLMPLFHLRLRPSLGQATVPWIEAGIGWFAVWRLWRNQRRAA